jgi:hypothetical protein
VTQGSRSIRRYIPPLLFDAPDFRQLWLGQTISVFGDQITQLGLPLVAALTLGADATQMGTLRSRAAAGPNGPDSPPKRNGAEGKARFPGPDASLAGPRRRS